MVVSNPENTDEARKSGEPAVMVSDAFLQFTYMRSELNEFTKFYHSLAGKAIGIHAENPDENLYRDYRGQSIFFLENFISRISDFFDLYIEHLIYAVCLERSSFLAETAYSSAKKRLIKFGSAEPTDDDVMFEAAITLGRKDKSEIANHFETQIGYAISKVSPNWDDAIFCNKIRNVIVHKSSMMDERFVAFAKDRQCPFELAVGESLIMPEKWLMKLASSTDECIYAIDEAISDFVPVHKRNRYGHFWLPRSTWANPLTHVPERSAHT